MPNQVYIADRNDASSQVRSRLMTMPKTLDALAEMCANIERMDVELRELNQKLKQMQQTQRRLNEEANFTKTRAADRGT